MQKPLIKKKVKSIVKDVFITLLTWFLFALFCLGVYRGCAFAMKPIGDPKSNTSLSVRSGEGVSYETTYQNGQR